MRIFRRLLSLLPALSLVCASVEAQDSTEQLKAVLRAGTGVFVSGDEAAPEGFDVEIIKRYLAWQKSRTDRARSYQITFVDTINTLLDKAEAGECDLAIGSVTATEERDQRVDFSTPYLPVRIVLIGREGRLPEGSYQQILAGKRVGAIQGSTHVLALQELQKEIPDLLAKTDYSTADELFESLLEDSTPIDAAITDLSHYWVLKKTKSVVLLGSVGPEQGLAVVFPEGSSLRETFNGYLEEFLHSQSYFALVRSHFGQEADEMIRFARKK